MRKPLVVLLLLPLAAALLWPPNTGPDGAPDPFVDQRRAVLDRLVRWGVLSESQAAWCLPDRWEVSWNADGAPPSRVERITHEPVYRGLFFRTGQRITVEATDSTRAEELPVALRLCHETKGRTVIAGAARRLSADAYQFRVAGYVPDTADGWWVEELFADGRGRWIRAEGDAAWDIPTHPRRTAVSGGCWMTQNLADEREAAWRVPRTPSRIALDIAR